MLKKGLNVVLDGQWGSTGKGKLCGMLGTYQPHAVCSSFGPNAGHTFVNGKNSWVFKSLPSSAVTSTCPVLIMPDSVVVPERLFEEIDMLGGNRKVLIHPRTAVLTDDDRSAAQITGKHLAGTMQGTGHAIAKKLLRIKGVKLAKDVFPKHMVYDTCAYVRDLLSNGGTVLFEMSQGFDLSLNHGYDYPYLTSRDITVGAALNSCGCPPSVLSQVIGSIRVFPIRVGNIEGGNSGPCHPDQVEITWEEVTNSSHSKKKIEEYTTVTMRKRRVFTLSLCQLRRFVEVNNPDWIFLNFIQYLDSSMHGAVMKSQLTERAIDLIEMLEHELKVPVRAIGTGADLHEMVYRNKKDV